MSEPQPTTRRTIERLERRNTSHYGNPAWMVYFTDGSSARTQTDTGWSYEADNPEYRGATVDLWLTPSGRIRYARVVND
jgi:hypothetical protein